MFSETSPHLSTRVVMVVVCALTAPILFFVEIQSFAPQHTMLRDPLAVALWAKEDCCAAYFGFVSLLGSAMWTAAAAVSLLAWLFFLRVDSSHPRLRFFLLGFVVCAVLYLDDTFMLHEFVLPGYGIHEVLFYAALLLLIFVYLAKGRFLLWRKSGLMFILALAFLGSSVVIDAGTRASYIVEDGLKFIGIAIWAVFHFAIILEELHLQFCRGPAFGDRVLSSRATD